MVDFTNPVWETPILPPVPETVCGAAASLPLADRKKRDWKLLCMPIEDIPSPFSEKQDYDFDIVPEAQWKSIVVPGELSMQGVDVQNDREYYYRRTVRGMCRMSRGKRGFTNMKRMTAAIRRAVSGSCRRAGPAACPLEEERRHLIFLSMDK